MKYKGAGRHIILFCCLIVLLLLWVSNKTTITDWYVQYGFFGLQKWRCNLLNQISFSLGDLLYLLLFFWILARLFSWVKGRLWQDRHMLVATIIAILNFSLLSVLILSILWGTLYSKPKLSEQYSIENNQKLTKTQLFSFDSILISRLNDLASQIDSNSFTQVAATATDLYKGYYLPFDTKAKKSMYGNALAYLGVEGYFNPFTGEAQVNGNLPYFMLPFVLCHEMAHQSSIAPEDEANFLAYTTCVKSNLTNFKYAAYFNLWLYAQRKCFREDSVAAQKLKGTLNQVSLNHLQILKNRSKQYHTFLDDWSTAVYDMFLKAESQKEGIASYGDVVQAAYFWEQQQNLSNTLLLEK